MRTHPPPQHRSFTRFPRFARSRLVPPLVLLEAFSSFSAFSSFWTVILVLRVLLAYGDKVPARMVSGGPKMALLWTKEYACCMPSNQMQQQ